MMFPSSLMSEAINLATNCAERGIAINSAQDSFLDNLVNLTANAVDTSIPSLQTDGSRVERSQWIGDLDCDVHAQFTDESALAVAEVVTRNIMVARTDALPMIKQVMEQFEQVINPDIPYAYRRRAVVPVAFHSIWQSPYVQEAANTYADGINAGQVPQGLVLSNDEEQFTDFIALSKTGLPDVDKQIASLLGKYEDNYLRGLFHSVFSAGQLPVVKGPGSLTEGWINDQILIHIWARNLQELTPEKSAHSLAGYRAGLSVALQRSGNNIWNINKVRQNCAEGDVLILAYQGDKVFVHADIYTDWLKTQGGSPEIVLGASLLQGVLRPSSCADLLTMAPALIQKWNDYVSLNSRSEQENLNASARIELFRIVRSLVDGRKADGLLGVYEDVLATLNEMTSSLPTNFIDKPYPFIRNIVLGTFYVNTNVPEFVMAMDEIAASDDDLSEDEVAALATINYVTDWGSKLVVTKAGQI